FDYLGHRLCRGLLLAAGRHLRRQGQAPASARRVSRAGSVLPRSALAVAPRLLLHLGGMARRQAHRRPHRHPAQLPGLPRRQSAPGRLTHIHRFEEALPCLPIPASACSTPRTPTPTRAWTMTCAGPCAPATPCTCAARSAPTSPATWSAWATRARRP